jgi:hypothetical protein
VAAVDRAVGAEVRRRAARVVQVVASKVGAAEARRGEVRAVRGVAKAAVAGVVDSGIAVNEAVTWQVRALRPARGVTLDRPLATMPSR